jgi:hypothetical protein
MGVCYRCHKYVEMVKFHPTHEEPLAQICDDCKEQEIQVEKE